MPLALSKAVGSQRRYDTRPSMSTHGPAADALASMIPNAADTCALMFSGGRNSTLAAVRLHEEGQRVALVTLSSGHLRGIARVEERLGELRKILPGSTPWIHLRQPTDLQVNTSFYERTCLPCHHAYVVAAAVVARATRVPELAFGYAGYQNTWPEQTPLAVRRLSEVLDRFGISLRLPVYDIASREEVCSELKRRGLSPDALEQKCIRQTTNIALSPDDLRAQIALWGAAIDASLSSLSSIQVEVLNAAPLRSG